uniref:WSC domain-containing protein n=1 Tax=Macrostomum lignano TaxID=282301 RepID=A0A1I8F158_9PLAT
REPNETVRVFSERLIKAAEKCEFQNKDERLRDQFICGLNNQGIIGKLIVKDHKKLSFKDAASEAEAHAKQMFARRIRVPFTARQVGLEEQVIYKNFRDAAVPARIVLPLGRSMALIKTEEQKPVYRRAHLDQLRPCTDSDQQPGGQTDQTAEQSDIDQLPKSGEEGEPEDKEHLPPEDQGQPRRSYRLALKPRSYDDMRWGLIFILACCSLCDCPDALPSLGCYTDSDSQRDLPEQHQDFKLVSKHYCLDYCRASGYLYFGMQSGTWCNCGDSYGRYERVSRGECNQLCPDGATGNETCGGAWLNEIFPTGVAGQLDDGMNSSEYLGCFNDSINSQQLPLRRQFGTLQNKDWCLCGNAHSSKTDCRSLCAINPAREEPGKVLRRPTKGGEKIGCFTDSSDRDLPLVLNAGQMASRQHCWHQCVSRGYAYFGLQAASFCTCGNVYGRYGKLADDRCSMTCAGAWDQTCGAGMVNEVFSTGLPEWTDRSVIRVGCFVDAASRDLPLHRKFTDGADRFSCWQFCYQRGYKRARSASAATSSDGTVERAATRSAAQLVIETPARPAAAAGRNEIFATGIERMAENAIARLGCYQDGSVRDLQLLHEAGSATSRLACWHYCKLRGYRYFGLQAGRYCACGNSYGRHGVASGEPLYKNEVFTTAMPADWETGVVRLGCLWTSMTEICPYCWTRGHLASKYHCWTYCRSNGYKYFGLQDGTMCTCGNAYGRHGQVDANVTRQGCFKAGNDSSTDLPLVQRTGSSTRRQHCWQFCESRGYRYFGLQSGDLCACGNSVRRLGQVDDAECNVRCRGFAGETCARENHTEVFTTGVGAWGEDFIIL